MSHCNQLPVRTAKIRGYDPITSRQLIETHFGRAEIQNERFLNIRTVRCIRYIRSVTSFPRIKPFGNLRPVMHHIKSESVRSCPSPVRPREQWHRARLRELLLKMVLLVSQLPLSSEKPSLPAPGTSGTPRHPRCCSPAAQRST